MDETMLRFVNMTSHSRRLGTRREYESFTWKTAHNDYQFDNDRPLQEERPLNGALLSDRSVPQTAAY
ncbi:hypothetical protein [Bifidobacterium tsurumiense]|uniref:hypothetical protein n=1 Tax=Bifidobacterium tsurumiense TaxID=356829 RepID=UPI0003FECD7C|nr:hypothetical protein [Bifidobacterium tsurumiense]